MIENIAGAILAVSLHGTTQPNVVPTWKHVQNTYYDERYEKFRKCVVKRESEGIPTVVNRSSHAQGLYQFLPTWTRTLAHVLHRPATPIHTWPASVQTAGFWFALNHGRGAHHWSGGRWDCSRLLP
jgi:hypothetical protein